MMRITFDNLEGGEHLEQIVTMSSTGVRVQLHDSCTMTMHVDITCEDDPVVSLVFTRSGHNAQLRASEIVKLDRLSRSLKALQQAATQPQTTSPA